MRKKNKNLLISFFIVAAWAWFSYSVSSGKIIDYAFLLFVVLIIVNYAIFITGAITLILRIRFGTKDKNSLFYILCGCLNFYIGAVGMYKFITGEIAANLLFFSALSLAVGIVILKDIFSSESGDSTSR